MKQVRRLSTMFALLVALAACGGGSAVDAGAPSGSSDQDLGAFDTTSDDVIGELAALFVDGKCPEGEEYQDAGFLPPFFDIAEYDVYEVTEPVKSAGRGPGLSGGSITGVMLSGQGEKAAVGEHPVSVHESLALAFNEAWTDKDHRLLVASRAGLANFAIVLSPDGNAEFVGSCIETWESALVDFARSEGLTPATVVERLGTDPRSEFSAQLVQFSTDRHSGEDQVDHEWADLPASGRFYMPGYTPDEVLASLQTIRVAVRFPDQWREKEIFLCPRSTEAWSECISSLATSDGHTVVWTAYVEPGSMLSWHLLEAPLDVRKAIPFFGVDSSDARAASEGDGILQLILPDSFADAASALATPRATEGNTFDLAVGPAAAGRGASYQLLTVEEFEALEQSEAKVGPIAVPPTIPTPEP